MEKVYRGREVAKEGCVVVHKVVAYQRRSQVGIRHSTKTPVEC